MTWQDLKNYIDEQSEHNKNFLKKQVFVYDYDDGEEHIVDVMELLEKKQKEDECGWVSYLTINEEIEDGETEEASISRLS